MFVHHVYFWLKDGTSDAARQQVIDDARKFLATIPSVRNLWTGRPAGTSRPIVENSYDIGLCVILDDLAGHDVYQEHPQHLEFIARNQACWKRVLVYDFKE